MRQVWLSLEKAFQGRILKLERQTEEVMKKLVLTLMALAIEAPNLKRSDMEGGNCVDKFNDGLIRFKHRTKPAIIFSLDKCLNSLTSSSSSLKRKIKFISKN